MSESNNVKFLEDNGKWLWKRYDESGSVTYTSPLFDSEQEARNDFEANNQQQPEQASIAGTTAPEGDTSAGTATGEQSAS